jgi:hypothetical protein
MGTTNFIVVENASVNVHTAHVDSVIRNGEMCNPTQLVSHFACPNLRESACS